MSDDLDLAGLKALFVRAGCDRLYAKPLAENDNSKNQVYFGPDFQALNLFPIQGIFPDSSLKNPIFKALVRFSWLLPDGRESAAPEAKLILYPQYPEVRFSGFLRGSEAAPSRVMARRSSGRVLFLGVSPKRDVLGFAAAGDSRLAIEFRNSPPTHGIGVFSEISLPRTPGAMDSRARLLAELGRVSRAGWIDSYQLDAEGKRSPCNAPQCGGFTLEAELGIPKNSDASPDFLGWEIKQHAVSNFDRLETGQITLMTPEPTGGLYHAQGPEAFVRKFGYPDKLGRVDRINFGGVHKAGAVHPTTGLMLRISGYDRDSGRVRDANGAIELTTTAGEVAASWSFARMLEHWSRKHAQAAYVPSQRRSDPGRQYRYGPKVRLAEGTDPLKLLRALAGGIVYYDPGIKVEKASSGSPAVKRRSQFRVKSKDIAALYESVNTVTV